MVDLVPLWGLPCATRCTGSEKESGNTDRIRQRRCREAGARILDFRNLLESGSGLVWVYASLSTILHDYSIHFICLF